LLYRDNIIFENVSECKMKKKKTVHIIRKHGSRADQIEKRIMDKNYFEDTIQRVL